MRPAGAARHEPDTFGPAATPRRLGAIVPMPASDDGDEAPRDEAPAPPPPFRTRRLPRPTLRIGIWSVAELVLIALLALQCARLFWTVVAPAGPVGPWTAPVAAPVAAPQPAAGLDFDPFFRNAAAAGPAVVTSLDLTLHGIREDRATGRGSAIIGTPEGQQSSFEVGEEIMPGVVLTAVAADSVTISHEGRTEQIFFAPDAGTAGPAPAAPPAEPQQ